MRQITLVGVTERSRTGLLEETQIGRTRNLSHDGVCVELDQPIAAGSMVLLHLELGESMLEIPTRVRSTRGQISPELRSSRWRMGMAFMDMSPDDYDKLNAFLQLQGADAIPDPCGN